MTSNSNGISRVGRLLLAALGLASWAAGGTATFLGTNGAGAAALIAAGGVIGLLGLIGRWPSRLSMSGNEVSWENVDETVRSQILVAQQGDEGESVLAELTSLRSRLAALQQTGSVPEHPAETYDRAVLAAIARLLPAAEIRRTDTSRSLSVPDFLVRYQGSEILAETKWRADPARPFSGRTLPDLVAKLPPDAKLLVIVNASVPPLPCAEEVLRDGLAGRARLVNWLDIRDDDALAQALAELLGPPPKRR